MLLHSTEGMAAVVRKRILIVEGNRNDVRRLRRYLTAEGYEVEEAGGCEEACERVASGEIDLLVLGSTSSQAEGGTLCERVHGNPDTAAIPIIAIIAPSSDGKGMTAVEIGADDFVRRPVNRADLLIRTRTMLRMKQLHDDLRSRNADLERVNRELAARNRELEQGLEMAQRLQEALLPQEYPPIKNISFCHLYMPADVVGGDFFQITGMSRERAAILVCDVSGHGIRAALITSILKAVFGHVYLEDKNATQILCDINSRFRSILGQLAPQIFATGFLLVVDGENCTVSVACAGHVCPFLIRKRDMSCEPLMREDEIGPALALFHSPDYPREEVQLSGGDIVLGLTDGVYEVLSAEGEMYGLERLRRFIAQNARLIPRDLIQKIVTETDQFRGPRKRADDLCLVAVEVH